MLTRRATVRLGSVAAGLALLAAAGSGRAAPDPPPAAPPGAGRAGYDAALAAARRGEAAAAARAFEEFARTHPGDVVADDALAQAAQLAEERLGEPARALALYRTILERYPNRRASRRAEVRARFLEQALRSGAAPLAEYQQIVGGFGSRPKDESIRRMQALLARTPGFALADRAAYWIGSVYLQQRRFDEALAAFAAVEARYPASEWAQRARKARGDILAERGDLTGARRAYESIMRDGDPSFAATGAFAAARVTTELWRARLARAGLWVALLALALALVALRRVGRGLLAIPVEVKLYVPAAALFTALAWRDNPALGRALLELVAVVAVGLHLLGHLAREAAAQPRRRRWRRGLALGLGVVLFVGAVGFRAVYRSGLMSMALETVRNGVER
ncbi:MAG TPA: tetratricopeptide repeat protein [Polyangia bacterium]